MNHSNTIAHLFGEAIQDSPHDLFIPPDALQIILNQFEGPLDLLLYLIRKQHIDILDIPMTTITRQYLDYINLLEEQQLNLAAEYLLMAAVLIEIKSRLLLPKSIKEEDSEIDPRAELVQRLLAYEQMKQASNDLNERPQAGRDFLWAYLPLEPVVRSTLPDVSLQELQHAWLNILNRAKQFSHHQISQEPLSVRAQMSSILAFLQHNNPCHFSELFTVEEGVRIVVVSFIALLELIKEGHINIQQQDAFSPISVLLLN